MNDLPKTKIKHSEAENVDHIKGKKMILENISPFPLHFKFMC